MYLVAMLYIVENKLKRSLTLDCYTTSTGASPWPPARRDIIAKLQRQ